MKVAAKSGRCCHRTAPHGPPVNKTSLHLSESFRALSRFFIDRPVFAVVLSLVVSPPA
jgi:hypothetical protein